MKNTFFTVLFAAASTLLLLQCSRDGVEPLPGDMAAELALFPENAMTLGYTNVQAAEESPFFSFFQEQLEPRLDEDPDYTEFRELTGFDFRQDVQSVYFALVTSGEGHEPAPLFVVNGNFEPEKIMGYISKRDERHTLKSENFRNFKLYTIRRKKMAFCFVDNHRMVAGKLPLVRQWITNLDGSSQTSLSDRSMYPLIKSVPFKSGSWLVLDTAPVISKLEEAARVHPEARRLQGLKAVKSLMICAKPGETLRIKGMGNFTDSEQAKLFHDAFRGLLATAKLSVSEDRETIDILNDIETRVEKDRILFNFELKKDDLQKLMQRRQEWAQR